MSRCRFTEAARLDLLDISDFVAQDDPVIAFRIVDEIEMKCQALVRMPGMGRSRDELASGLRSTIAGTYLIFYRATEDGIEVIRVVHGARDLPRLFGRGS